MTEINRKAGVIWNGDLRSGNGMISTESRVLYEQPYSYGTRFENETGTNPEELLAAAHAACYSMAVASTLKKNGFTPKEVETNASCVLESRDGSDAITRMYLHVRAEVPGIDDATFQRLAREADQSCPVSNLLRDALQIDFKADLIEN